MGAGISHCEEKHEEPASGQQDIQSSDTVWRVVRRVVCRCMQLVIWHQSDAISA